MPGISQRRHNTGSNGLKIIIIGCGKVGTAIVSHLIGEGHDISVIDKNPERVQNITDKFDVMGIVGNGASFHVLEDAGIDDTDVLIAVTESDELNLLCCMIGKRGNKCDVIARVRTPEYNQEAEYLKDKLGLAMIINPDREAALAIARMLAMPKTISVNTFANGMAELVQIRLPKDNVMVGRKISELGRELAGALLICGVERDDQVYIPNGQFTLAAGDQVTFIMPVADGIATMKKIGFDADPVRNTMIIGGGKIGYYLLEILSHTPMQITMIERDRDRCEYISMTFPEIIVINGDGTDDYLLKEIGIQDAESVVALTNIDEENILLAPFIKGVSNARFIAKISRSNYDNALKQLEVDSVVYPKHITSEAIIAYVRSKKAAMDSNIQTLVHLFQNKAEAIEFLVERESKLTQLPLRELKLKENILISCIYRDGSILIPGGNDMIRQGDSVIVFTTQQGLHDVEDILK